MKIKPGIYKHFKGHLYRVLFVGKHSETREDMIVYESLYKDALSRYWIRPASMFSEKVMVNGKSIPRFTFIEE